MFSVSILNFWHIFTEIKVLAYFYHNIKILAYFLLLRLYFGLFHFLNLALFPNQNQDVGIFLLSILKFWQIFSIKIKKISFPLLQSTCHIWATMKFFLILCQNNFLFWSSYSPTCKFWQFLQHQYLNFVIFSTFSFKFWLLFVIYISISALFGHQLLKLGLFSSSMFNIFALLPASAFKFFQFF